MVDFAWYDRLEGAGWTVCPHELHLGGVRLGVHERQPSARAAAVQARVKGFVPLFVYDLVLSRCRTQLVPHDIFGEQSLWILLEIEKVLPISGPGEVRSCFAQYLGQELARIGIEYSDLVDPSTHEVLCDGDETPVIRGCQVSEAIVVIAFGAAIAVYQDLLSCL